VESREEVLKILERAREEKINPISLESDEEDDFQITIGDVMPNEKVIIKITYMDQLIYDDNLVRVIIPSVIDPTYISSETEEELDEASEFNLNLLVETYGEVTIKSHSHKIKVERHDETLRKVTMDQGQTLEKDLVLDIVEDKPRQADGIAYAYYDQENESDQAILMLRFFPILPDNEIDDPKNYTFIVDNSSSMAGFKAEQSKTAVLIALRNLNEGDHFNIISFDKEINVFRSQGKVPYSEESLAAATEWIEKLELNDGADIYSALRMALRDVEQADVPEYMFLFSDDMVEDEDEIIEYVRTNIGNARLFTVGMDTDLNSYFINKLAEVGMGMSEFVEEGQRVDDIILRQFHRIHNPQLDVTDIDWGAMQVEKTFPGTISYLYDREPFTIFAEVIGEIEGKVTLKGNVKGREGEHEHILVADLDRLEIVENSKLIEKVWTRKLIEALEERERKVRGHEKEQIRERILELSKEYKMLSSETAFILTESIEDPVTGFAMQRVVPLEMSEDTMRLLSESFFLDDTRYSSDITIRETMAQKGISRKEALEVIQFERENLLRILAKNQLADGSFCDAGCTEETHMLETTLKALLAFTIGKEPATIYLNNINKAFSFVMKTIRKDEVLLTERNLMLLSIAYDMADGKRLIKEKTKVALDKLFDRIEEGQFPSSLKEVEAVIDHTSPQQMKYIMAAALNISSSQIEGLEEIFEKDIKSNISRISEVALAKAL
jgi:Ca-activated chloride channel family protein